ncbi:hypothetical protein BU15DRAFT_43926 [Melanogaster broomeanus]|nr:hypothetical protein BU15DRAFT_43926 [Melanogaster broomeanus]
MATVTHIIRSHYDPADRERLEHETGQLDKDQPDLWQTESAFSAQRRIRAAPSFVPATVSYDDWGLPLQSTSVPASISTTPDKPSTSTAQWYRSLTAAPSTPPRPSSNPSLVDPPPPPSLRRRETITKNNWFIRRALRSEPPTKPSSPAPSLADLLARDPPPQPSDKRYTPPVWLHIGPSNKGFSMLQRSGWNEGEGLGAHLARPLVDAEEDYTESSARRRSVGQTNQSWSARAEETGSGIRETREVIDLTQSDSDSEDESEDGDPCLPTRPTNLVHPICRSRLLTPLPTILKADRLGIGLKAKTEGPYKQSKKRVTHNAAALAAHIRTAEEMRRKKAEVGRGKRGYAKLHRREEDRRKLLLAYLNE